jgi:hypothetical protein
LHSFYFVVGYSDKDTFTIEDMPISIGVSQEATLPWIILSGHNLYPRKRRLLKERRH